VEKERNGVKWGRVRAKRKHPHPPGLAVAHAERPDSPPGLAKRRPHKKPREAKDKDKDKDKR